jgi:hypothetical protein
MAHLARQTGSMHATRPGGARLTARRVASARPSRKQVQAKALFSFLTPKAPKAPQADPRCEELVDNLIDMCARTDAGAKASPAAKEQIAELVGGGAAGLGAAAGCAGGGRAWGRANTGDAGQ